MKKLLIIALLFTTVKSFALTDTIPAVDTSTLNITISLKVKYIEYMGSLLASNSSLADAKYRDSLVKYCGSGNNIDSVVTTHFKAGLIFNLEKNLLSEQANVSYAYCYEFFNGATGYTGLLATLFTKGANGSDSEQGVAKWLFTQVANWYLLGGTIMTDKINRGKIWLTTPIIYN